MGPVSVDRAGDSGMYIITVSGSRYRKDGSIAIKITNANYLVVRLDDGEFRLAGLFLKPLARI